MSEQESHGGETGPLSPEDVTSESPFTLPGFFAALSEGRLLGARCADCDVRLVPPRPACYGCGSRRVGIEEQPRTGAVVTFTAVHRPPPAFEDEAPITIAIVELDSGVRMTGRLSVPYEDASIGMPVRLEIHDPSEVELEASLSYEEDWPLHVFEPS